MNTVNYGDISPRTAGFAVRKLLERGQYLMTLERFGQVDPQGKNKTLTRKYRRYNSVARAIAPMAEGIPPAGQMLSYTDINVTLEQYGDHVKLTDVIVDTHEDPVLDECMGILGEQIAETVEVIRYNVLKAGTNVVYSGSATTRGTVSSAPLRGDLRRIVRSLKKNKAREISTIISATAKISTEPVAPAYFAVGHTDLDSDIRAMSGFVPVEQYSDSTKALPGEVGKVETIRFVLSALFEPFLASGASTTDKLTNGATGTGSCDVYPILVFGRDAFAMVPLQGSNAVTPTVINPGKPDKSDPHGQIGFVAWKRYDGCVILNQLWMCRYECAVTSNPT